MNGGINGAISYVQDRGEVVKDDVHSCGNHRDELRTCARGRLLTETRLFSRKHGFCAVPDVRGFSAQEYVRKLLRAQGELGHWRAAQPMVTRAWLTQLDLRQGELGQNGMRNKHMCA
jgi:hypothetical protein